MNDRAKQIWIEAYASVLQRFRGMSEGEATTKAKAEFARFQRLDQKRKDT